MFVIFKIRIIYDFPTYERNINFNQRRLAQEKLVRITEAVEKECPVEMYFYQKGKSKWAFSNCR
jgi:hypothetical protein